MKRKKKKKKKKKNNAQRKDRYDLQKLNDIFFVCVCYGFHFYKYFIALNSKTRRRNEIGQDFGGGIVYAFGIFPFVLSRLK